MRKIEIQWVGAEDTDTRMVDNFWLENGWLVAETEGVRNYYPAHTVEWLGASVPEPMFLGKNPFVGTNT